MAIREEYGDSKPLDGHRIVGCLHMTIQTAVLIETLVYLGATAKMELMQYFFTQDHAGSNSCKRHSSICLERNDRRGFWWCIEKTLEGPDGWKPNMILDDGGDATKVIHEKVSKCWKKF